MDSATEVFYVNRLSRRGKIMQKAGFDLNKVGRHFFKVRSGNQEKEKSRVKKENKVCHLL